MRCLVCQFCCSEMNLSAVCVYGFTYLNHYNLNDLTLATQTNIKE
jgi:hypothetical protein